MIGIDKCSNPTVIQKTDLPTNTMLGVGNSFSVTDLSGTISSGNNLDIKFLPPFGQLTASLNGGSFQPFAQAVVTVQSNDASVVRNIFIDGVSGRVDTNAVILPTQ